MLEGVVADLLEKDAKQMELHKKLHLCQNVAGTDSLALHVKKVFGVLADSYPKEALQKLEEVSYLIKEEKDLSKFLCVDDTRDYKAQAADLADYIAKYKSMHERAKPNDEDGEDVAPMDEEIPPIGLVQDLMKDIRLFAWAGVGFG